MNERILQKLAILVGETVKDEGTLSLILDILLQKIRNYCNRNDIPSGLELIIVEMLADYYKALNPNDTKTKGEIENTGEIKSITRGKTRIEYNVAEKKSNKVSSVDELMENYKRQLIRFKKAGSVRMNEGDDYE